MNMNANERSSHPSTAQIEALIEFLESNPDIAKGFSKTSNARDRNRRQWEEVTITLNSMGGTIKTAKQWNKYWTDKKSAIKKKVAARAAARRRTGGGLDDIVELSEVEDRIVALFGGEGFGTGDTHLAIQLFPENVTPEPVPSSSGITTQRIDYYNAAAQQQERPPSVETRENIVLVPEQNIQTARRLFVSSEDVFATAPNQSISHDLRREYSSPPPPTLSQTPSPLPMPSPSHRRGVVVTTSNCIVRPSNNSVSSRNTQPLTSQLSATPVLTSEASPSRRGAAASGTNTRAPSRRTNTNSRANRLSAASSFLTRRPAATPPSQRQTEFNRITDRFLRVEERQLELQQSNARILQSMMEHSVERDRVLTEAVVAMGEGFKALAEAIKRNN